MLVNVLRESNSGKPLEVVYTYPRYLAEDLVTKETKAKWMQKAGGDEAKARYMYRQAHHGRRMVGPKDGRYTQGVRKYTPGIWETCISELDVFEIALAMIDFWLLSEEGSEEEKKACEVLYTEYNYLFHSETLEKAMKEMNGIARCRSSDVKYAIENGLRLLPHVVTGQKSKVFKASNYVVGIDIALLNGLDD